MRTLTLRKAWRRAARLLALGAAGLLLAGCATGYALVQPDVAGAGAYYSGDAYAGAYDGGEAYTGTGYYDVWGTGPYYPGTAGFGYYDGSWPYGGAGGWYGLGFSYGYASPFAFGIGFSNVWNFPGYWGPWYAPNVAVWGCRWRCDGHRGHYWRHHAGHGGHGVHGPGEHRWNGHAWARGETVSAPVRPWRRVVDGRARMGVADFATRALVEAPRAPGGQPRANFDAPRPAWRTQPLRPDLAEGAPPFGRPALQGRSHLAPPPAFHGAPRFAPAPAFRAPAPTFRAPAPQPMARSVDRRGDVR